VVNASGWLQVYDESHEDPCRGVTRDAARIEDEPIERCSVLSPVQLGREAESAQSTALNNSEPK